MRGHARVRHGIKPCQAFLPVSPTGWNFGFQIYNEPDKMTGGGKNISFDFGSIFFQQSEKGPILLNFLVIVDLIILAYNNILATEDGYEFFFIPV